MIDTAHPDGNLAIEVGIRGGAVTAVLGVIAAVTKKISGLLQKKRKRRAR